MSILKSSNIKKTETWIALLEQGKLASEYNDYKNKAKNAPNMVKNFAIELKKKPNEYKKFIATINELIADNKISEQDLNFINQHFDINFPLSENEQEEKPSPTNSYSTLIGQFIKQESFKSNNIKKPETWIHCLRNQCLVRRYDQYAGKAPNAPRMVNNFVKELQRNNNEYNQFQEMIHSLIQSQEVTQEDLDFINILFELNFKTLENQQTPETSTPASLSTRLISDTPYPDLSSNYLSTQNLTGSHNRSIDANCSIYFTVVHEEAAGTLSELLQNAQIYNNKEIFIVERMPESKNSDIEGANPRLFQKPLAFYNIKSIETSYTVNSNEHLLAQALKQIRPSAKEMDEMSIPEEKKGQGLLHLYRVNKPQKSTGQIFIYRSAELGYQQKLAEWFAKEVITALRVHAEAKYGDSAIIDANMLATAGAIKEEISPGKTQIISGSFYVGHDRIPGTESYKAVVKFAHSTGEETIYESDESFITKKQAITHAKYFWMTMSEFRNTTQSELEENERQSPKLIKENHKKYVAAIKIDRILNLGINVSQTVPFFDGAGFKRDSTHVFRCLVDPVNMEDYAFFKAMHGTKLKIANFKRFITNAKVPASFSAAFGTWFPTASFSETDYIEAILWGLEGQDPLNIPETAIWDLYSVEENPESLILETQIALQHSGKPILINPFYAEIASDMLINLIPHNGEPGEGFPTIDELKAMNGIEKLTKQQEEQLKEQMLALGTKAQFIENTGYVSNIGERKKNISELIQGLRYLTIETEEGKLMPMRFLAKDCESEKLEIWTRKGKWEYDGKKQPCSTLSTLFDDGMQALSREQLEKLDGAFDRMFYKITVLAITKGLAVYEQLHCLPNIDKNANTKKDKGKAAEKEHDTRYLEPLSFLRVRSAPDETGKYLSPQPSTPNSY